MSENLSASASVAGTFKWKPADGLSNDTVANPVARPNNSTTYQVTVTNQFGCKDSAYVPIDVYTPPVAHSGDDKIIVAGDTTNLNGSVSGTDVNYFWSPPQYMDDSHSLQPAVYPAQDIVYTLNVVSTVGCGSATDDVKVKVYNDIFIPNSFTPNGDGKNDMFRVLPYNNYKLLKMLIYDRWGTLIFQSNDINKGWDGTSDGISQPLDTYVYLLELENSKGKRIIKKGTVVLLR